MNDLFFSASKNTKDFFKSFFLFGSMEHNRSNIIYIYQTKYILYIFIYTINICIYIYIYIYIYIFVWCMYIYIYIIQNCFSTLSSELTSNHILLEADLGCHQHLRWSSCDKTSWQETVSSFQKELYLRCAGDVDQPVLTKDLGNIIVGIRITKCWFHHFCCWFIAVTKNIKRQNLRTRNGIATINIYFISNFVIFLLWFFRFIDFYFIFIIFFSLRLLTNL